jgi:hypothetical protein
VGDRTSNTTRTIGVSPWGAGLEGKLDGSNHLFDLSITPALFATDFVELKMNGVERSNIDAAAKRRTLPLRAYFVLSMEPGEIPNFQPFCWFRANQHASPIQDQLREIAACLTVIFDAHFQNSLALPGRDRRKGKRPGEKERARSRKNNCHRRCGEIAAMSLRISLSSHLSV